MILVLDNEVDPDLRYLGPEIVRRFPETTYEVFPEEPAVPDLDGIAGVILTGSTASVYEAEHAEWVRRQVDLVQRCLDAALPTLGICFGHQLVNHALGGAVEPDQFRGCFVRLTEYDRQDRLLAGLEPVVPVIHSDVVTEPGRGMEAIAKTAYSEYFCTRHETRPLWTVQFHPELTPDIAASIDEFRPHEYTFGDTNADIVLDNFASACGIG